MAKKSAGTAGKGAKDKSDKKMDAELPATAGAEPILEPGEIRELEQGETASSARVTIPVLPESLITNPKIKALREWSGHSVQEQEIDDLAASILEEGQLQDALAWETDDGLVLVCGERRRQAVAKLREQGHTTIFLNVAVDKNIATEEEAIRKAIEENERRSNFNDVERALNIGFIRKEFGWEGSKFTANLANYLRMDPATLTQLERLAKLPSPVLDQVRAGTLKTSVALELTHTQETAGGEAATEVATRAHELAEEREEKKRAAKEAKEKKEREHNPRPPVPEFRPGKEKNGGKKKGTKGGESGESGDTVSEADDISADVPAPPALPPAPARTTIADVRKAEREKLGDAAKLRAPKPSEIADLFDSFDGPAYQPQLRALAVALSAFVHGKLNVKKVTAAWDDVSDLLPDVLVEKNVTTPTAAAKKKTAPKAAPKKAVKKVAAKKSAPKSATKPKKVAAPKTGGNNGKAGKNGKNGGKK